MQFSEQWLRALIDPPLDTVALNHLLTMSGLEVESCEGVAPAFDQVVVGLVASVAPHPNADRLRVCQVDVGAGAPLNIVCGAPNVVAGMKAPVALVGAKLPGEAGGKSLAIAPVVMRGVESKGMLCSARELGLSQDHSGLLSLASDAKVGSSIRETLALDDSIILIKLTPNRADCLSMLGIAREVAALTGTAMTPPPVTAVPASLKEALPVKLSAPTGCGRFTGRIIRGVNPRAPTPEWMRRRLERAGQRCISALVDVTNYVMLELGRPLHVYDLDKLQGGIDVRFGRLGETLKLLNEQTVTLDESVLAICDDRGPIGLAGIMGGDSTKADDTTTNVFLESAFFFPDAIAGRARRFNFASDASHRFERGVDFDNNIDGIERATRLILDLCGGEPGPTMDTRGVLPERAPVRMRLARAHKIIGVAVPEADVRQTFRRLGFATTIEGAGDKTVYVVTPPSYRFDITIEEDLIEEVARVYGFERIPANPPMARATMTYPLESSRSLYDLREVIAAAGYQEVVNFSFVDATWETDFGAESSPIRLLNPIANQYSVMRSTLLGGLVANVQYNLNRQADRIRVFEVGRIYRRRTDIADGPLAVKGIDQPIHIAGIAYGQSVEEQWGATKRFVDFFDVKSDIALLWQGATPKFQAGRHPAMQPGRCASVEIKGAIVGWLGELHPRLAQKYDLPRSPVVFEFATAPSLGRPIPVFEAVSKLPAVVRDQAFWVPDTTLAGAMLEAILGSGIALVKAANVFDLYRGDSAPKGRKSLAFRIVMQDTERTLTDAEVEEILARIRTNLTTKFNASLRT
ncbi:MAG: phenylalanine--tRNA ligase subunit beta [Betaproteobacteria bacterium]|nr:phenylalanine--tRNA ligase subunit beta [Betaproteobacteria bacterium]